MLWISIGCDPGPVVSAKKASICVLGLGVGMLHARAYSGMDDVELYVCDTSPERVEQARKELRVAGSFSKVEDALDSDVVDAVDVSLPNNLHGPVTVEAARHGKHAFVEKPLATSLAEADLMKDQCAASGTLLAVAENWQFSAANLKASAMIRADEVGKVFLIDVLHEMWPIYFGRSSWWFDKRQTGGGVLLSAGVHAIRTLRMLSPSQPAGVYAAWSSSALGIAGEDTCAVTVDFADGSIGSILASWATPHAEHLFAAHGTKGSIIGRRDGGVMIRANRPGDERETGVPLAVTDTVGEECAVFARSVLAGRVDDRISFERGRADIEVVEAAYRSATEKRRVELPLRD